jgi:hypothetical protein
MTLKGTWSAEDTYDVGDVVKYTDGIVYHLQQAADAGTPPTNTLYWAMLDQTLGEAVCLMLDAVELAAEKASEGAQALLETYFVNDKTLVLGSSTEDSDKRFAITVDDSGDIDAAEIVEEGEGGES